jgi:hypothetical protein
MFSKGSDLLTIANAKQVTKAKIHFVNVNKQLVMNEAGTKDEKGTGGWTNILHFIAPEQLPTRFGGTFDFEFEHETYWKNFSLL